MSYNFNDPLTGGGLAPLQSSAVSAQAQAPVNTGSLMGTQMGGYQPVGVPSTGGSSGGGFFKAGGGASLALGAISTLGSLWNSFQQNKLAKKSLALQTRAFETNLGNQTQTYNTALEDRIRSRYATEGRSGEADAYIDRNKL